MRIWRQCPRGVWPWPRPGPGDAPPLTGAPPRAAPLRRCPTRRLRAAGLPTGPHGLRAAARRLAPSSRSGTSLPRPLGNYLQGDRAPPPAPTPGTEPTCALACGVPVPPAARPSRRRALSSWGDPASRGMGAGGGGSVPGRTRLRWEGRGRGLRSGVGCLMLSSPDLLASLLCLRGAADPGALLSPLMR